MLIKQSEVNFAEGNSNGRLGDSPRKAGHRRYSAHKCRPCPVQVGTPEQCAPPIGREIDGSETEWLPSFRHHQLEQE